MHNGANEIKIDGNDWLIMWSTKQIKLEQYAKMNKY